MQRNKFARTLNQVERTLRNTSINSTGPKKSSYLSCRYTPFGQQTMHLSVPDGLGSNITTRDYLGTYDIVTPTNGTLDVQILPFIPQQISVYPTAIGSTAIVNGKTITRVANSAPVPFSPETMSAFRHSADAPTQAHYISSGRVVTVGFRLYYTGPASTCAGVLQADDYPIIVDQTPFSNTAPLQAIDVTGVTAPNVPNIKLIVIDLPTEAVAPTKNSVIVRPEAGLTGVLRRRTRAENHSFKPFHETGLGLISQENNVAIEKGGPLFSGFSGDGTTSWTFITLVDDDFNATRIRINGVSQSYRLEVMTCVQFNHHPNYSLMSLTSPPGPSNPAILEADDKINGAMPPAMTLASQPPLPQRRPRRRPNKPTRNGNGNTRPSDNGTAKTQNNRRPPRRGTNKKTNK